MKQSTFVYQKEFSLENGKNIKGLELQYGTLGALNSDGTNVVWVCHALTANSDFTDWWSGLIEQQFDPSEYFIICANMLGGCYGSTGPLSENPETGQPYYHSFPQITNRDIVKAFDILRKELKINSIQVMIGGSMGGQQALEWSIIRPDLVKNLVLVATNARHSSWGIAYNETQRMAIETDPTWQQDHPKAGMEGMKTARAVALLSYRCYQTYENTQNDLDVAIDDFSASSYQRYQGLKLYRRFNAYTYWYLSKSMDSHNVARGRGGMAEALGSVKAHTVIIGIRSDNLFPLTEQRFLAMHIPDSEYHEIESDYGHDGFLLELDQLSAILGNLGAPKANKISANG